MSPRQAKDKDAFDWDQLERLRAAAGPPAKAFTEIQFMQRFNLKRTAARTSLDYLLERGELVKIKCGMRNYYRYKEST